MRDFIRFLWYRLLTRKAQLTFGLRTTVAAMASLAIALALGLKLPLWAVLTALIVTQMSVGRSLKTTRDYVLGTIGGAVYGGAIAVLIPHSGEASLLGVLILAVAPLAFLSAVHPSYSAATVTSVTVLLLPTMNHMTPVESAIDRVLEVCVGAGVGLLVSFIVLPARAQNEMRNAAARVLDLTAAAFAELLSGATEGRDTAQLHRIQDGIGTAVASLNALGTEAARERSAYLARGPDTGPLLRTLLRLRHDLVMIGRATVTPLPTPLQLRLAPLLTAIAKAFGENLTSSANALRHSRAPPPLGPVRQALLLYSKEVAALRKDGAIRELPGDAAEKFYAIGFSLEQMRMNLSDLERCIGEWADRHSVSKSPKNGKSKEETHD